MKRCTHPRHVSTAPPNYPPMPANKPGVVGLGTLTVAVMVGTLISHKLGWRTPNSLNPPARERGEGRRRDGGGGEEESEGEEGGRYSLVGP